LYGTIRDLAQLVKYDMSPEAATINFYNNAKQTMGGHLDDAEKDMSKPIVSCSFGNSVIFLMGGKTRDVPPVALYIKSGDTMIMAGDARLSYHGVCRVMANTCPEYLLQESENYDSHCVEFISKGRINMNCRQVFYKQ
jgi:alkylated DNA repair protein alkB family protein 1